VQAKQDYLQKTIINDLVNPALQTLDKEGTKEVKTIEADFRKGRQKIQEDLKKKLNYYHKKLVKRVLNHFNWLLPIYQIK